MTAALPPLTTAVDFDPFAEPALARVVPSTAAQQEIWLACQLGDEASLAYNESISLHFEGELDAARVQAALDALAMRHDALRASFSPDGQSLVIAAEGDWPLALHTAESLNEEQAQALRLQAVQQPFHLTHGPLLQAWLLARGPQTHELILTAHHLVCDGWSFGVLATELAALLRGEALAPAPSFAEHAEQQTGSDARRANEADTHWWLQQHQPVADALDLPADFARTPARSTASRREDLTLPPSLVEPLRALGSQHGASLFVTLFSAFAGLLARLSGQADLVVGVPAAGQAVNGEPGLVGHCVQLLPLRTQPELDRPFTEVLAQQRTVVLDAYEHPHCTFGQLLQKLQLLRDPARPPLVSLLFNLDSAIPEAGLATPALRTRLHSNPRTHETFELFLNATQAEDALVLECQYHTALFEAGTIRRWLALLHCGLQRLVAQPTLSLAEAFAPTPQEVQQLAAFNATAQPLPPHARVEAWVAAQAAATPQAPALVAGAQRLNYQQLQARALAVAAALQARGVRAGDRVGLHCARNEHLLIGLLGILNAGAAYVPLEPSWPEERLRTMCRSAGIDWLVCEGSSVTAFNRDSAKVLWIDALSDEHAQPAPHGGGTEAPAYVLYTSGSTGEPKGVAVPHRAVLNLLASVAREPGMQARHRVLSVTTLSFDIAVSEVLLPLTVGACIVLASREQTLDGAALRDLVERERVDFIDATPSTWRLLLAARWPGHPGLRAICTGEPLPPDLGLQLLPKVGELWNGYGPTETTVWSSFHHVTAIEGPVPIGRPIANTQFHVLDARQRPLPLGAVGELVIGGQGVALGYLGRQDLTDERFLPDPARPGHRFYRTGDLGRWRHDGVLECRGRIDHQVKLRGYRIETGEIEALLCRLPAVGQALIVKHANAQGDESLVAYVVPRGGEFDGEHLKQQLRSHLPEYMLPQHWVPLAALPLLPNGKLNRRALPAPQAVAAPQAGREPPQGELETRIAQAMAQALALPSVARHDNFFALGGHSLAAARLVGSLGEGLQTQVPMRALFEAPTVAALALWLGQHAAQALSIPARAEQATAPVTAMQYRLWFLEQLKPGQLTYHTPSAHRLRGPLDVPALQAALQAFVQRHASLRTVFEVNGGEPMQVVLPEVAATLPPLQDLSALPELPRQRALAEALDSLTAEPFNLQQGPLFHLALFRLAEQEHVLFFCTHHLVWDGWSFDLFTAEVGALYAAFAAGRPSPLALLPLSYGDFAAWHAGWLNAPAQREQLQHWVQHLANPPEPLALPLDKPRPAELSNQAATHWLQMPPAEVEALREFGQGQDATLFMVLLAAYALTLHQTTGQADLVIGVPVRGRPLPVLEGIAGLFVNALPLRLRIDRGATVRTLLRQVQQEVVRAFQHPDVPFEALVRELKLPRDRSRFPVYQTLFSYQDARDRQTHWGELAHDMQHILQPALAEDLSLWLMDRPQGLVGGLAYSTDLLHPASAQRLAERFHHLLRQLPALAGTPVAELPLPPGEAQALAQWNATAQPLPAAAWLQDRVATQWPDAVALQHGSQQCSYAELEALSNQWAQALRARGAGPGTRVGLCLERGVAMVVGLLAVLKTGAAYVPLDPAYPAARLQHMASHAGLVVLLAQQAHAGRVGVAAERCLFVDADAATLAAASCEPLPPLVGDAADTPAYVIYTSGSTGVPKGVVVPHGAALNFLASMAREPGLQRADSLVAVTTLSFDIALLELMLPLSVGARVVIASAQQAADPQALAALLQASGATAMQATPGTWQLLLEAGWQPPAGFKALVGGEALPPELARRLLPQVAELWNLYGPTETTVWSTCGRVLDADAPIRIGRPIANTQVHVLDDQQRPCALGSAGELCIGGLGVALGYLHQPELTAERFLPDPFRPGVPGARLYRTGDRARWCPDGQLEHLGRFDDQVKLRGHRIELGEVSSVLERHPQVAQAVAVLREDTPGDVRLVAYLVPRAEVADAELREHLKAALPAYMLPQHLVRVAALPRLPNGKVDRRALPAPAQEAPAAAAPPTRPLTPTEGHLAGLWCQALKLNAVQPQDNFFDLGGHSLLLMQVVMAMEAHCGRRIDRTRYVFETLAQLARGYDEAAPVPAEAPQGTVRRLLGGLFGRGRGQ